LREVLGLGRNPASLDLPLLRIDNSRGFCFARFAFMRPHQLELFYHVARAKGVTRAAREMPYGIQQPSVSAQVNALERDLGVTLYERRPFKLTPAGEALFEFVAPFFGRINEVRAKLQGAAQMRVGAATMVLKDYFPPVLEAMQRQFPNLNLILRAMNQPELLAAIEHDELDVVISLLPENLSPGLRAEEIIKLPLVLLVPRNSRLRSAKDLWTNGSVSEPLIALPPNELICQLFHQTLAERGLSWLPRIEMDSLELIEKYVEKGFGVGLSICPPRQQWPTAIRALKLSEFPAARLGLIYRNQPKPEPAVLRAFREEVRRQAAQFI
jgi:DNA-binding transcriptional LysR family regulator